MELIKLQLFMLFVITHMIRVSTLNMRGLCMEPQTFSLVQMNQMFVYQHKINQRKQYFIFEHFCRKFPFDIQKCTERLFTTEPQITTEHQRIPQNTENIPQNFTHYNIITKYTTEHQNYFIKCKSYYSELHCLLFGLHQ